MDSNISSNNENTPKKETIVIPPEPVKQPEIPATFNSPALFEKEEVKKKPEITEYPKSKNYKKTLLILIGVIVFIAIGIFSIIQISLSTKYTYTFNPSENQGVPTEEQTPEEDTGDSLNMEECGGFPYVQVISPDQNQIFKIGDTIDFRIEICGIGSSLFQKAMVEYYEKDTGNKVGEFSLHCIAPLGSFQNNIQTISWQVPPFLEESSAKQNCLLPVVNFLKSYTYQLRVEYAGGLYKHTSPMFVIDSTEYTYSPPQFSEYTITIDTDFDRSPFIDSSAPQFLKDVIFSSYFQAPPLFANYYRWYVIPNGPAFLIDLRDGKTYPSPQTTGRVFTKPLSTLYISENPLEQALETGQTHEIGWYNFTEETKHFENIVQRFCVVELGVTNNTYTDCIPTK